MMKFRRSHQVVYALPAITRTANTQMAIGRIICPDDFESVVSDNRGIGQGGCGLIVQGEYFLQSLFAIAIAGFTSKNQLLDVTDYAVGIRYSAAPGARLQPSVNLMCLLQQPQAVQEVGYGQTYPDIAKGQTNDAAQDRCDDQSCLFTVAKGNTCHLLLVTVVTGRKTSSRKSLLRQG